MKKILIMAGGTGGHVFPGLALADEFKLRGCEVHWLGTQRGLESKLVPEAGIPFNTISVEGIRGKRVNQLLLMPFQLVFSLYQSLNIIRHLKPDFVIGMGGYVSGPGGLASFLLRKPLYIHEQNSIGGTTNRLLARLAKHVFTGFPDAFNHGIHVGNPIASDILSLPEPNIRFDKREGPLRLLILGGSRGALAINQVIPDALNLLASSQQVDVLHQTGSEHLSSTEALYKEHTVNARIVPFIDDMRSAYEWADVAICRAGALTVSELAAAGLGSILIPFPFAVDDHQTQNAAYLVGNDAGILLPQQELNAKRLAEILSNLDRKRLLEMAESAYTLRTSYATKIVADGIIGWRTSYA